ncbi:MULTISPECIES: hypothetical protein [Synechocystis]|uniref:Slr0613 protein n=1 Tax=Synechocystis salina LEGE 00031 TaxID=1828736 RepID=A0ABR9VWK5_9SYNC|nr:MULTISPECIES: hypothetical protein [Synechocystis]MBD2653958.1 hypothetical protein [Synechocystis sp. FACHB-383]MBE9196992.1 hypothetical protein [Synechocystis sp. LEGE 06083]MBE9242482.1 hypothetical protein [Synechocystis salina LEGE 00041]MBE9254631.1 hypothetical protein [Synechocystis salina LEGE 00031]
MSYLIAVVANRIAAEEAYTTLEQAGFAQKNLTIIGTGYKTADEFGLVDPKKQALKRAKLMAIWLVPFGFAAGYCFNLITGLSTLDWAGDPGNHIVGGLLGAIGGAMGSFFVGGGVGLSFGSGDSLPYRNLLQAGKYLVVVAGGELQKQRATNLLRPLNPEYLQGYTAPDEVLV